MDYFFAQIEERENPQFKGKPVVVGADPAPEQVRCGAGPKGEPIIKTIPRGRGVVSTANYVARKYGIHSAMPISKAYQLCPNAIFLPVNMKLYENVSRRIMEIIKRYSPQWEIVSLDEVSLDLSYVFRDRKKYSIDEIWEKAEGIAKNLKKEIFEKEKLTATVGIGPNKLIAKMASEKAKPNGLLVIKPNQVKKFLELLDIEDLPGIGPKTAERLRALDVNKIKDLKKLSKTKLREMFGKVGEVIFDRARGIDEEPVTSEEIIKSIGREHTFENDTRDPEIIFNTFERLIEEVDRDRVSGNFSFKTITVICRFSGFETHTKSKTLKAPTQDLEILKKEAKKLLLKFLVENSKLLRLIGLRIKIC